MEENASSLSGASADAFFLKRNTANYKLQNRFNSNKKTKEINPHQNQSDPAMGNGSLQWKIFEKV